ncbi:MAG: hypothetical protein HYZ81_21690 [Nitrospinae bacterium]|nr:hypothetical protein [Nitrospinota bacterium]
MRAHDRSLLGDLETLVAPVTRGDSMSPLRWTCKSAARLAAELHTQGHAVSERTVTRLLHDLGYRLPSNRKTLEGRQHPDREAQFQHMNRRVKAFQRQGATRGIGRYPAEGTRRSLAQRWPGVAPPGAARAGEGPCLS